MTPTFDACLFSWPWRPWLLMACVVAATVYVRGWRFLRRRDPMRWHAGRAVAYLASLATIYLALASPLEPLAGLLLEVHMVQHLLLLMVAPPLVWLAAPLLPLLHGLPTPLRRHWAAPLVRSKPLRRVAQRLTHPAAALPFFITANLLWHVPANYELALRSDGWHYAQHVCFLLAGLLFWHPVVRPHPSRPRWSPWLLLPYLLLGDVQNTLLSAWLTFADKVLYPYYSEVPRLGNLSALDDQAVAGVIMWVPGSLVFLLPLFWIGVRLLYGSTAAHPPEALATIAKKRRGPRLRFGAGGIPRLRFGFVWKPLAAFLRWRHARTAVQVPLLLLAAVVIYDGVAGPQASPLNLAGVLPWTHWRGLVVLTLLAVGNLSCMACPFTLPRGLAGRWLPRRYTWPRWLRSKWLAAGLIVLFLWSYEALAIWDSPCWTAWIAVGYFVAAFAVDGFFQGAAFCKYVCPIGQFNFIQSLVSPVEVAVYDHQVCAGCRTKDCLHGRDGIPGCELELYQPRKSGNMDCTFCLDCLHACPHNNVGFVASLPGSQLWHDRFRWGVGRLSRRPDVAALAAVLVFGAFANAAGMVAPVVEWQDEWRAACGLSTQAIVTICSLLAIVVAPVVAISLAAAASRRLSGMSVVETAVRYTYVLVPLGFAMWLAHYSFHLVTSYATVVPATQRFAADLGLTGLGEPQWQCACCLPSPDWLLRAELMFLDFGFLASLYTAYRLAAADGGRRWQKIKGLLPWAMLTTTLFLFGVWIVFQPMQMRGTMMPGG